MTEHNLHLYFPKHNLAIAPVRKVASTTIREELKRVFRRPEDYSSCAMEQLPLDVVFAMYYRSPLDRALSLWRHQIKPRGDDLNPNFAKLGMWGGMSFLHFCEVVLSVPDGVDEHITSQYYYIPPSPKRHLFDLAHIKQNWWQFNDVIEQCTGRRLASNPAQWNPTKLSEHELARISINEMAPAAKLLKHRYSADFALFGGV